MNAVITLIHRLTLRPLWREPLRTALTVFAVALGVSVVIAIELAGQAATGSFHSSLESFTGKGGLVIRGTAGVDETLLGRLAQLPYDFRFSPRIEDFAAVEGAGEALPFIGIDLIASQIDISGTKIFGAPEQSLPSFLDRPNPIWVTAGTNLQAGNTVSLVVNDRVHRCFVAGVLKPSKDQPSGQNAIVTDIGVAQRIAGKTGKLDAIEVTLPPSRTPERWEQLLQRELPVGASLEGQGARTDENRKMLSAFRWNLRVLSYIALIVGTFLIYNTISVSVVRRRNEIGIVRALGGTRAAVALGCLAEAAFFGLTGSFAGVFLGRLLAVGAVQLIGNTVQALYISSQPGAVLLTSGASLVGIALGCGMSLLAALGPMLEAARVAPVEALARGREEYKMAMRTKVQNVVAILLLLCAAFLSLVPAIGGQPLGAYGAVLCLIAGTAAAIPGLIVHLSPLAQRASAHLLGVEAVLATRSLRASVGRTSILIAALATAVAMTTSVGIMVGSFRNTVIVWMNNQLKADLYLRPAKFAGADQHPTMSADVADRIARLTGVESVDRFRAYAISYDGVPATLASSEPTKEANSASTALLSGDRGKILKQFSRGDFAIVSEPFANKHHVGVGSVVSLPLGGVARKFTVLGVYYDYSTERGYIVVDRKTLLKYLPDPASSNLAVYVKRGINPQDVRKEVDRIIAGRNVAVFSNGALRRAAIATFDRTFRITYATEVIAIAVAVMGIAGSLLAMVIDRRRELALFRFLGASRVQIRRVVLYEAGVIGLFANLVGLVIGTALSLILVFVINKQSFGWTIQFYWPATIVFGALTGVYVATVLAGIYPAQAALKLNPLEAIYEG